ncbi:MAG TPA: FtsX-like permease family protein [Prolixibacteraceae bacterium]|nr:FtsX-like permease family protein [Prolixibacteraceae bacterium]
MDTEFFIARKVFSNKENKKGIASRIVSIAVASISISLAVMILSVSVLIGFKKQIREKVMGFGAHFQLVNYDSNYSFETIPVGIDSTLIEKCLSLSRVKHVQLFATKPGLVKTDNDIHGIVLKGAGKNYDWQFFSNNLIRGRIPETTKPERNNEVLLSEKIARLLKLDVGDPLYCYFFNEGESAPRSRKFDITGIYQTRLEEFDELFVLTDLRHVQSLNAWSNREVSGYEILLHDPAYIDEVYPLLRALTLSEANENNMLRAYSIEAKYPMLFDWLDVLDMNVWVLLVLMLAVAGINMVSGLLIIMIERVRMIGILKALGYPDFRIRKIFVYLSAFLSGRGMVLGNIIGLALCTLQYFTGIVKLDPVSYYLDVVPVSFPVLYFILLNGATLAGILLMTLIPSLFVRKISPVEAIQVE